MILEKTNIALIQLRRAIQLFNKNDFVCAITLAGAADDIFGKLAKYRKGYNDLDGDKKFFDDIAEMTEQHKLSYDKVKKVINRVKNEVKHHESAENTYIETNFEFEAQHFIDSAIRNYWIAYDQPPNDRIINRYVEWAWT